jgi:hypothetical protein
MQYFALNVSNTSLADKYLASYDRLHTRIDAKYPLPLTDLHEN